jgi:purine-nucleoside phosphorylase
VALILGSGLGDYVSGLQDSVSLPLAEIPGFPSSRVAGHPGRLVFGRSDSGARASRALSPREGLGAAEVAFPVRVFHALGARAGRHQRGRRVAPISVPAISFSSTTTSTSSSETLARARASRGSIPFRDLARPYATRLLEAARAAALAVPVPRVLTGTYWSTLGPAYETPAEVRMIRRLGGDAVGMSTVNEVLVARQLDLEVLGIACIANLAASLGPSRLDHDDVLRTVAGTAGRLGRLLDATLPALAGPFSAA